ncbi:hypothetical protein B0H17DRAFT_1191531 [Mycena rosella]|uniref:Uncharacterized protein n=1 Tax=Mycena rosella TaxID=1033263 RepID=A0AAD7MB99_MYCRO|nr:hypothetical protein B0H17DRAFT_1191531 [Mycena rosella]
MSSLHSFEVDSTLGALLIGVLVSYVLFGVTTTQVYIYHGRFPKDSGKMKALVAFVWFCELAHVVCVGQTLYVLVISDFAHPERLGTIPKALGVASVFNALVASSVQGFFSFRIFRLTKRLYIPFLTGTLSILSFLATVMLFVIGLQTPFTMVAVKWGPFLNSLWSVAAGNDLMIAGTLVFWLWRRRDNSHQMTGALVDKLIAWNIVIWVACLNSRTTLRTMSTALPVSVSYPVYSWNNYSNAELADMPLSAMRVPASPLTRASYLSQPK